MKLLLDAIGAATDGGRRDAQRSRVIAALFATRDRHSAVGTYSIEPDGDTTLARYGVYRIVGGRLVFWRAIDEPDRSSTRGGWSLRRRVGAWLAGQADAGGPLRAAGLRYVKDWL